MEAHSTVQGCDAKGKGRSQLAHTGKSIEKKKKNKRGVNIISELKELAAGGELFYMAMQPHYTDSI